MSRLLPVFGLLLLLTGCGFAGPEEETLDPVFIGPNPVRQVLGFVIERTEVEGLYRLVRLWPTRQVVCQGEMGSCENALLERLEAKYGTGKFNIPFFTLGGKQFWADCYYHCGWRIQQNVFTDHFRLLDRADKRRAWGSYGACRTAFEKIRVARGLTPASGHLVILLHGLLRSKDSFAHLSAELRNEGYEVAAINYPSTRGTLASHTAQLVGLLNRIDGVEQVSFVTHSLGGIVVRQLLAREAAWQGRIKVGRLVMLAPPNQGSYGAEVGKDWFIFKALIGAVGQELTPEKVAAIPVPTCPFGIIAGGKGRPEGFNPLLPGDNDGTILVETTRLPGAADWLRVNCSHTWIMRDKQVIEAVITFLGEGHFPGH